MSDFDSNRRFNGQNRQVDTVDESLAPDKDFIMEQILENLNTTPIGKVLKKIASLPDGRKDKVLDVRQQLTEGKYEFNEYLDVALDKVLEDLTA
ncbi:MAG: hypothetical protein GY845_14550 [Planctomycetes bacterium]|jgi:hypothetical protein|nr:hypothetical protein [Planctomycetota bacterium]MDT8301135.1 hypothetical protein [Sedimentisphaerales bacterium]